MADSSGDGGQSLSFLALLGAVSTTFAIVATLLGVGRWLRSRYLATLGRRKVLRSKLSQLASEVRIEFIEQLFGPSLFRRRFGELVKDVWWLREAVVQTICDEDGAVKAFSVTAMTEKLRYSYQLHGSHGAHMTLGVTPYVDIAIADDSRGIHAWAGNHHWGYREIYYLGNPGLYQTFWLGYNDVSRVGDPTMRLGKLLQALSRIQSPSDCDTTNVHPNYLQDQSVASALRDLRSNHSPNTLTVLAPHWSFKTDGGHSFDYVADALRVVPAFYESFRKPRRNFIKRKC